MPTTRYGTGRQPGHIDKSAERPEALVRQGDKKRLIRTVGGRKHRRRIYWGSGVLPGGVTILYLSWGTTFVPAENATGDPP